LAKVVDNVLLPLEIVEPYRRRFGVQKAKYRQQAEGLLATVGLDDFSERYPWSSPAACSSESPYAAPSSTNPPS
jgi:ABC-type nitrate/sulfonate/bicarbonate transport system ATPase subunit